MKILLLYLLITFCLAGNIFGYWNIMLIKFIYNCCPNEAHSMEAKKYIYQIITIIKCNTGKLVHYKIRVSKSLWADIWHK